MVELSVSELINLAEAVGIISTLFVIFYFSRKGVKSAFEGGTISEYWEKNIQPEKWFDPDFQDFINKEIMKQKSV